MLFLSALCVVHYWSTHLFSPQSLQVHNFNEQIFDCFTASFTFLFVLIYFFILYGSSEKCSIYLLQKLTGGTAECINMIVPNWIVKKHFKISFAVPYTWLGLLRKCYNINSKKLCYKLKIAFRADFFNTFHNFV